MNEEHPPAREESSRQHWYNPASLPDSDEEAPIRRGKARERMRRRREMQEQQEQTPPELPRVTWSSGVIAAAVVGIIAIILLIAAASGGGITPLPTSTSRPLIANATLLANNPAISIKAWSGTQRYTVLIMGLDKRPGETGTGFRTDTLIIASIDPVTKSIGMLSIPRDLYVPMPDQPGSSELQRINTAYVIGELNRPGGGPLLAMQTVQYNFGIPINAYVAVSFDAVIGVVDAIGGIDIDVKEAINDPEYPDMYYGYDPLYIPSGVVHMNGQLALKYARTRHQGTDYDRANRQQQVLLAIKQKATKPDTLPQLVGQAPAIWDQVSKGVISDIAFDQMLSLGWYAKDIPADKIHRGAVADKYVQAIQYNGESVITPNRAALSELMTQVFGANYGK